MKTTYLVIAAIFSVAFFALPASSQIRQTTLNIDDNTGHFLSLVVANLGGVGKTITFPNKAGTVALLSDITSGGAASFTNLTVAPTAGDGITINNIGNGNDITGTGSLWSVDNSGEGTFSKLSVLGTGSLEMNNAPITDVADPTSPDDAANKGYVDGAISTGDAFSSITGATNHDQAMVVGNGSSLDWTGSGTINASSLEGGTWEVPGTIGSTTANTGAFTSLSSTNSPVDGLTITTPIGSNDITGDSWNVTNAGAATFSTVNTANAQITGGSISNAAISFTSLTVAQVISSQAAPPTLVSQTFDTPPAVITGLSLSANSTDAAGEIFFTTDGNESGGNNGGGGIDHIELDFHAATTHGPIVVISPATDVDASEPVYVIADEINNNFTIYFANGWNSGPSAHAFYYHVIDTQ